jgi:hypothetical protein
MKILFCNVGWMESYKGLTADDQIVGGGAYVRIEGMGHEVCNFARYHGRVYGYVQPPKAEGKPGEGQINIDRLGGKGEKFVDGVLVVWTATRPEGGTVVVGWYKNATVYRFHQRFQRVPELQRENGINGYRIKAKISDATLLPIDQRTCEIPRQVKGGMGQSNVWFAASSESKPIVKKVINLVEGKKKNRGQRVPHRTDPDHNAKVEKSAINAVRKYYENNFYTVESVESDNVGWDLEATSGKVKLKIEVKGLSGKTSSVQLTPNEYSAFEKKSTSYRLAIVTQALSTPNLIICRFSRESNQWIVDGSGQCKVSIEPKISAIVQVAT